MNRKYLGIVCAAASAVIYGVTPTLVRMAYDQALSTATVMLLRSLISLPITAVLFFLTRAPGETLLPERRDWGKLLPGYMAMALTTLLLCISYNYIPVGMVTTLHFVYPILVNLGCVWVFREKLSPGKLLSLMLASAGIILFLEAGSAANRLGIVLALLSGACYGFYMIYLSWSGMDRRNPFGHTFTVNIFAALMGIVMGGLGGGLTFQIPARALGCVGLVAVTDSILGVVLLQLGIRFAGASAASVLSTLEPITSVLMGYLVLREKMTDRKLLGCVCIVVSVLVIARSELAAAGKGTRTAP